MKRNKFFYRILIILFFSFILPFSLQAFEFEKGFSLGFGYESIESNSNSSIDSDMGDLVFDFQLIGRLRVDKRVQIFPILGYRSSSAAFSGSQETDKAFKSFYAGGKVGWILYPFYFPFIGASAYVNYYDQFLDQKDKLVITVNFSAGSKVIRFKDSDLWLMFDIGLFNSEYKDYVYSSFSLSISYLFH